MSLAFRTRVPQLASPSLARQRFLLLLFGIFAGLVLPARRASLIDPLKALRQD